MSQLQLYQQLYCQEYNELFGCSHRWSVIYGDKSFCQQCGLFLSPGIRVFKTLKMKYNVFFNPIQQMKFALKSRLPLLDLKNNIEYIQVRPQIIDFILCTADLLHISVNTAFLAIQFLDQFVDQNSISDSQMYLYAATSLMVAAKAGELDERIPFISKLKKYASMTTHPEISSYKTSEFKIAEQKIIQTLRWHLQQLTLIDRVEYLISFGVLDDDDSLSSTFNVQQANTNTPLKEQNTQASLKSSNDLHVRQKSQSQIETPEKKSCRVKELRNVQILDLVRTIESKYKEICIQIIKDKIIFEQDQIILALSCIAYLRKNIGLLNIWSQQLQILTDYSAQQISATVSQLISIFQKIQKPQSTSNYQSNSFQIQNQNQNNYSYISVKKQSEVGLVSKIAMQPSQSSLQLGLRSEGLKTTRRANQQTYLNSNENSQASSFLKDLEITKPLKLTQPSNCTSFSFTKPQQFVRMSSKIFPGRLYQ